MTDTYITNPDDGKGPSNLFRYGNGDDMIVADAPGGIGFYIYSGGGNDTIGGSDAGDTLVSGGGNDTIVGGGGEDWIYGGKSNGSEGNGPNAGTANVLFGDAGYSYTLDAATGTMVETLVVQSSLTTSLDATASDDHIFGGDVSNNDIYGDYENVTLTGNADDLVAPVFMGGSDTLFGGNNDGNDTVDGSNIPQNNVYGDANTATLGLNTDFSGGDDVITGGTNGDNSLHGDVLSVVFQAGADNATFTGGTDVITGGDGVGGGVAINDLYGDTVYVYFSAATGESFEGGDDTLTAGDGPQSSNPLNPANKLYGDAASIFGAGDAEGGADTLVAGTATDHLWGDFAVVSATSTAVGGADKFVFYDGTGIDTIWDFEVGKDSVELNGFGFDNFGQLDFTDDGIGNTTLDLGGGDQIIFNGVEFADFFGDEFSFG